ncbi:MAG: hypothetical protein MHPSP_001600, partial [Paramarteilia canceri]
AQEGKHLRETAERYRNIHQYELAESYDRQADRLYKKMKKYKKKRTHVEYEMEDASIDFSGAIENCDLKEVNGYFVLWSLSDAKKNAKKLNDSIDSIYVTCDNTKVRYMKLNYIQIFK